MPSYVIAGKRIKTANPLTDDQIDEIAQQESGGSAADQAASTVRARLPAGDPMKFNPPRWKGELTNFQPQPKINPVFGVDESKLPPEMRYQSPVDQLDDIAQETGKATLLASLPEFMLGIGAAGLPVGAARLAGAVGTGVAAGALDKGLGALGVPDSVRHVAATALGIGGVGHAWKNIPPEAGTIDSEVPYLKRILSGFSRGEEGAPVVPDEMQADAHLNTPEGKLAQAASAARGESTPNWQPDPTDPIPMAQRLRSITATEPQGPQPNPMYGPGVDAPQDAHIGTRLQSAAQGAGGPPQWTPASPNASSAAARLASIAEGRIPEIAPNTEPLGPPRTAAPSSSAAAPTTTSARAPRASTSRAGDTSARVSTLSRAMDEAAQIKRLLGDATQRMNTTLDPAERVALGRQVAQLTKQLNTRLIRISGGGGTPPSGLVTTE